MTREEEIKFRDECAKIVFEIAIKDAVEDKCAFDVIDCIAKMAYKHADAMLEEKKKRDRKSTEIGN